MAESVAMSKKTLDPIAEALASFDALPDGFTEAAVADALRKVRDAVPDEHRHRWWAEWAASLFREVEDGESVWGTAFGPMSVLQSEAGETMYAPDIKDADVSTIDHWAQRAAESKHPILKARYADLVWEFAAIAANRKPDVNHARAAIDAYIDASRLECRSAIQPIQYVTRALNLALATSDKARIAAVVEATFVLHDRVASPGQAGTSPFLFDNLMARKGIVLTDTQTAKVIDGLENVLRVSSVFGGDAFNQISAEGAASRLAQHYRRLGQPAEAHRVWRAFGTAIEQAAEQVSPMLALGWLHPVLAMYVREGLRADAARVTRFLSGNQDRLSKEFKGISADFSIPAEKMKEYVDDLTEGGLDNALGTIAVKFISSASQARELLDEGAKRTPFQSMMPIQKIRDGHVVAVIGSVEGDPEGRLVNQLALNISIQTIFLLATVDRMLERYAPEASGIASWVCACGLFAGRETLIEEGVQAFLAGDDLKAVHVLLPQIESGLRELAGSVMIPTKRLVLQSGVMEDRNLSDILGDPDFQSVADEEMVLYLKALLNDKRGHNIRNEVMHGVVPAAYFNRSISVRILHVILLLGVIRVKRRASAENAGSS